MTRVIVYRKDGSFVNLEATRIDADEDNIWVYMNDELVGVFALSDVNAAYRSEKKEGKQ